MVDAHLRGKLDQVARAHLAGTHYRRGQARAQAAAQAALGVVYLGIAGAVCVILPVLALVSWQFFHANQVTALTVLAPAPFIAVSFGNTAIGTFVGSYRMWRAAD